MSRVLVVDDDVYIGDMLESALKCAGYEACRAYSGTEAVMCVQSKDPDLILLDLMLPGLSGEEVLKVTGVTPVIVMSAKIDVDSKVNCLLEGAVDYVTKPFEVKELLARIKVHLRNMPNKGRCLEYSDLVLNTQTQELLVQGQPVKITGTEFAILKLLMKNPQQVVTRSVILDKISYDTPDCTERSLKQHISNLRKKMHEVSHKDYIQTMWGIGFKLSEE
ncbi:MAG: response regulator transcription factor [Clostridia bacterium]|nr:response regulator transcription factor [Clostridia bacterium]